MMYCPSAPMFQMPARNPSERPIAIRISGPAFTSSCGARIAGELAVKQRVPEDRADHLERVLAQDREHDAARDHRQDHRQHRRCRRPEPAGVGTFLKREHDASPVRSGRSPHAPMALPSRSCRMMRHLHAVRAAHHQADLVHRQALRRAAACVSRPSFSTAKRSAISSSSSRSWLITTHRRPFCRPVEDAPAGSPPPPRRRRPRSAG